MNTPRPPPLWAQALLVVAATVPLAEATATITSLNPTAVSVYGGMPLTVTGTNLAGASCFFSIARDVRYNWTTAFTTTSGQQGTCITPNFTSGYTNPVTLTLSGATTTLTILDTRHLLATCDFSRGKMLPVLRLGTVGLEQVAGANSTFTMTYNDVTGIGIPQGVYPYHVHIAPVGDNCTMTGGHFTAPPVNQDPIPSLGIVNITANTATVNTSDFFTQLSFTNGGVLGRSIVMHNNSLIQPGTRYACCNITGVTDAFAYTFPILNGTGTMSVTQTVNQKAILSYTLPAAPSSPISVYVHSGATCGNISVQFPSADFPAVLIINQQSATIQSDFLQLYGRFTMVGLPLVFRNVNQTMLACTILDNGRITPSVPLSAPHTSALPVLAIPALMATMLALL